MNGPHKSAEMLEEQFPAGKKRSQNKVTSAKGHKQKERHTKFADHTMKLGVKGLTAEYHTLKKGAIDLNRMFAFIAANPTGKNRYKDVGCLDCTRVVLEGPNNYIHANFVQNVSQTSKRYICTQGPVSGSMIDFWNMIALQQVNSIIMLCDFVENNHNKCNIYYPLEHGRAMPLDENLSVVALERTKHTFRVDTRCVLMITKLQIKRFEKVSNCTHYHWMVWPDRGVPEPDLAAVELLGLVRKDGKEPIVVHCSAGIGRTGSIVLLDYLLEAQFNDILADTALNYLKNIRSQREGAVQTEQQYVWVHVVFLTYLKKRNLLNDSQMEKMKAFLSDYHELSANVKE